MHLYPSLFTSTRLLSRCCSLSISVCFFFFVFSPPCARLASPHVSVRLKVSSTRTGCQGESMNTWEHFVRWDITDSSASHWALNREAAQGFFFSFSLHFELSLRGMHSPFDKTLFILYSYCVERGVFFCMPGYCWAQSSSHCWMPERQM